MATSSSYDTGLVELDNNASFQQLLKSAGIKPKPQSTYSDKDKYLITKYANDHGASQAATFVNYPAKYESTGRTFVKKYNQNNKTAKACGQSSYKVLKNVMRGRLVMVEFPIEKSAEFHDFTL